MKKQKLAPRTGKALAMLGLLLITLTAFTSYIIVDHHGSATDAPGDLPHMWMKDVTGKTAERNFQKYVKPALASTQHPKVTESIYYQLTAFQGMVKYCNSLPGITYLDMYPVIPPAGDTLSLIFVAKDAQQNLLRYLMLRVDAPTFVEKTDTVKATDAENWEQNYITRIADANSLLNRKDKFNYKHCNSDSETDFSNTLYLHHKFTDYPELIAETGEQYKRHKVTITGIEAYFAAYPPRASGATGKRSNRLYVILEYDREDSARQRHRYPVPRDGRNWPGAGLPLGDCGVVISNFVSANNGQMCPPTCNP